MKRGVRPEPRKERQVMTIQEALEQARLAYLSHTSHTPGGCEDCIDCGANFRDPVHLRVGESREQRIALLANHEARAENAEVALSSANSRIRLAVELLEQHHRFGTCSNSYADAALAILSGKTPGPAALPKVPGPRMHG